MSYSFSARGATKADVMAKVVTELNNVVTGQPVHKADRQQAEAAVQAFLDILPDNADGKDFSVSVSGSVGWSGNLEDQALNAAGINVSASLVAAG